MLTGPPAGSPAPSGSVREPACPTAAPAVPVPRRGVWGGIVRRLIDPTRIRRFIAVGLVSTGVHLVVYYSATNLVDVDPLVAHPLGFVASLIVSYRLNSGWTFGAAPGGIWLFFRFAASAILTLGLSETALFVLTRSLGLSKNLSILLAVPIHPASNYVLASLWVFRRRD